METYFKIKLIEELIVYGVIFIFIALLILLLIISFIKGKIEDFMYKRQMKEEKEKNDEYNSRNQ